MEAKIKETRDGRYKVTLKFDNKLQLSRFIELVDVEVVENKPRKKYIVETILECMSQANYETL